MIRYEVLGPRNAEKYLNKAVEYLKVNGLRAPDKQIATFIAIDDKTDEIVGLCSLEQVYRIEPIVANNPLVAHVLAEKVLSLVQVNGLRLEIIVKSDKADKIDLFEKYGFVIRDRNITILEGE